MFKKMVLGVFVIVFCLPVMALAKGGGGGGHSSSGASSSGGGSRLGSSRSPGQVEARGRVAEGEVEARGRVAEGEIGHHGEVLDDGRHNQRGSGSDDSQARHENNMLFMKERLRVNGRLTEFEKEELISFLERQHNGPVDFSDAQHATDVKLLEKVVNDQWLINQQQRKNAIRRHFQGR